MKHILAVDDELGTRESIKAIFSGTCTVALASNAAEAMKRLVEKPADAVLLDVMMPDRSGLLLLPEIRALYPGVPVIMISALTSVRPVVEAMRIGAYDYVSKPFDVEEILHVVKRAMANSARDRRVETLESEVEREFPVRDIVGKSAVFQRALDDLRKAAASDATVLIQGESGTGKELAARLLHSLSNRRDEPFIAVHCAALPETLMESELFGHEKGAFTNADRQKLGRFDLAGSGTLFFDEVSEMSLITQVKLLRVLQEREFMRVGGTRLIRTDARIVVSTARDLRQLADEGRFRNDLFYRLSVVPVRLPPLREREGDIPLLADYFLRALRQNLDCRATRLDPATLDLLCRYRWPGNVRELRNIVERLLVLHGREESLKPEGLPDEFRGGAAVPAAPPTGDLTLEESVGRYERNLIEKALHEANGVQTRAAKLLGTTRRILRYRMDRLGLSAGAGSPDPGADE